MLNNVALKNLCVQHAGIQKFGVRGEAKIKKHIRSHITLYPHHRDHRGSWTIRLDLLQCYVTFTDCNSRVTGKTLFFLAEGGEKPFALFKLYPIKSYFYLGGGIHSENFIDLFSKENMLLDGEGIDKGISNQEESEEEFEIPWDFWNSKKLVGDIKEPGDGSSGEDGFQKSEDVPEKQKMPESSKNHVQGEGSSHSSNVKNTSFEVSLSPKKQEEIQ